MSALEVASAVVIAGGLVFAGGGVAVLRGWLGLGRARRAVGASTSAVQRRRARRQIRAAQPLQGAGVALVSVVATGLLGRGRLALVYVAITLSSLGRAVAPLPSWLVVLAGIAAVANLVIAVVLADDYRRTRRFLAAHPRVDDLVRRSAAAR